MSGQVGAVKQWVIPPTTTLADAYAVCEAITRHHSKSFFLATAFLPSEKRRAIRALYAFCRWSDDIVDLPQNDIGYSLEGWASHAYDDPDNTPLDPVLMAWNDTRRRYHLDPALIDDLLAGVRMDLTIKRYATFDDLWTYCYRVASTVGLLSMQIIGYEEGATPYAIKMGVALQLTNILRDVGEDARRGRIYLPQDELKQFGLRDQDILLGIMDDRWCRLMKFQVERAHRLYEEAWDGIALLNGEGRYAVAAACAIYRAILPVLERNGYDNQNQRAFVPTSQKLFMLPSIWWNTVRSKA
jgi:phytoene synthase